MEEIEWILCPVCKSKTRLKIRKDTVLKNFFVKHVKNTEEGRGENKEDFRGWGLTESASYTILICRRKVKRGRSCLILQETVTAGSERMRSSGRQRDRREDWDLFFGWNFFFFANGIVLWNIKQGG